MVGREGEAGGEEEKENKSQAGWSDLALQSPLDSKEIKPVHPKGNQPEYSLEELILKLKLQYFGHLM